MNQIRVRKFDDLVKSLQDEIQRFTFWHHSLEKKQTRKNVHQLRISIRRLQAITRLFKYGARVKTPTELKRDLRKMKEILGSRRQLDVMLKDAGDLHLPEKAIRKHLRKAKKKVDTLGRYTPEKQLRDFSEICQATQSNLNFDAGRALEKIKRDFFKNLPSHPHKMKDLHQFRIRVKKVRYSMEALGVRPAQLAKLRDCQQAIGRAHDFHVLRDQYRSRHFQHIHKIEEDWLKKAVRLIPASIRSVNGWA